MDPADDLPDLTPFVASVERVFRTMLRIDVQSAQAAERDDAPSDAVRASVGFEGLLRGSATLVMSRSAAQIAAEALLGRSVILGSGEFRDAMGELANMIAAGVAGRLAGRRARVSLPMVRMERREGEPPPGSALSILSFRMPAGSFDLEIAIERPLRRSA